MRLQTIFTTLTIVAASAASPSPAFGREPYSASVFATVGHSEWCRPGTVQLDLMTGRYTVTAPRTWRSCRRPAWAARTKTGVLTSLERVSIQVTFENAIGFGLEHPLCRGGGRPEQTVVSNGGRRIMRLTERGRTTVAPNDQSCWTGAASRLQCLLDILASPGERESGARRLRARPPSYSVPVAVHDCSRRWPLMGAPARPGG